ncbi:hypothetical protein [Streptomyces tsukubensis]|uniref:Lipoprotein n=1 Tax=Streptomyces tsukubensis TaxID=83656 RepID=A0A1V4A7Y5_9ACTN|nr:hypothetical protein [Streptomyces tsukubensis]OON78059.1 hypothetical protein B1H18_17740 [Streptomyces tsukubensis]QFR97224.1 hypothetical protein GBW32_34395 [Streptomyces tsukubensis]
MTYGFTRRKVALSAAGGLLAAAALAGCGDGGGSDGAKKQNTAGSSASEGSGAGGTPAVQAAYEKTSGARTAKMDLDMAVKAGGRSSEVTGTGAVDLKGGESDMTLTAEGQKIRQLTKGTVIYQKLPAGQRGQLPQGKSWMKIDLRKLQEKQGTSAASGTGMSDPAQSFGYTKGISGKDVKKVGPQTLDGVRTTHYRVSVDVDKLVKDAPAGQAKQLRQQLGDKLPMDIWLDSEGRLRQETMKLDMKRPKGETDGPAKASMTTTLRFSDFGTDVEVKAPSAKDTADMTAELARRGGSSKA